MYIYIYIYIYVCVYIYIHGCVGFGVTQHQEYLSRGSYGKDCSIWGSMWGSPYLRKLSSECFGKPSTLQAIFKFWGAFLTRRTSWLQQTKSGLTRSVLAINKSSRAVHST